MKAPLASSMKCYKGFGSCPFVTTPWTLPLLYLTLEVMRAFSEQEEGIVLDK